MEEAKLIRMATAISEFTISSMLHEAVRNAATTINQATLSVSNLPRIPERILNELVQTQQELAQLEQLVANYQKERAAEVEESQKDLLLGRFPQGSEELDSNFDTEA